MFNSIKSIFIAVIFLSMIGCSHSKKTDIPQPPAVLPEQVPDRVAPVGLPTSLPVKKASIGELLKCFDKGEAHIVEENEENGYLKVGWFGEKSEKETYATLHLYHGKQTDLVGWLDYDCGPICEQTVTWYHVSEPCKITKLVPNKIIPRKIDGVETYLSLTEDGKEAYVIESPAGDLDTDETPILIKAKYLWEKGHFSADPDFHPQESTLNAETYKKYFH